MIDIAKDPLIDSSEPNIDTGSSGSAVKDVQQRLISIGYDLGDEVDTGIYGEKTAKAIKTFREAQGLTSGSDVDRATWTTLVDATFTLGDRLLYLRMPFFHGRDVRVLQTALAVLGFFCPADGIFGAHTEHAVREFQQNAGINSDGIVGDSTFTAINRLRHAWEGKDLPHSEIPYSGFARAAEVLESRSFCFYGTDDLAYRVAKRISNLALATTENALVNYFRGEDEQASVKQNDEQSSPATLVELSSSIENVADAAINVDQDPTLKVIYDSDTTIAARVATAVSLLSEENPKILIHINCSSSESEGMKAHPDEAASFSAREEQHVAIFLLDALCSAFSSRYVS